MASITNPDYIVHIPGTGFHIAGSGNTSTTSRFELVRTSNSTHHWWLPYKNEVIKRAGDLFVNGYDPAEGRWIKSEYLNFSVTGTDVDKTGVVIDWGGQPLVTIPWSVYHELDNLINGKQAATAMPKTYPGWRPLHNPVKNQVEHDINDQGDLTWRIGPGGWGGLSGFYYLTDKVTGFDVIAFKMPSIDLLASGKPSSAAHSWKNSQWSYFSSGTEITLTHSTSGRSYTISAAEWAWVRDVGNGVIPWSDPYPGAVVTTPVKISFVAKAPLPKDFPHKCPRCGKACYFGLFDVDHQDSSLNSKCK